MKPLFFFLTLLGTTVFLLSCDSASEGGGEALLSWTFDEDLEGWQEGMADDESWGTVRWLKSFGGVVKLDGTGDRGNPNAWIYQEITLPKDARTLQFRTSAHNRNGADSALRVRLVEGSNSTTLLDWEVIKFTGTDGGQLTFVDRNVSIRDFAGRTVTLFFEQDDNGPGSHEQRYLDDILITR